MEPREIIGKIIDYIGEYGVVAGGCIRDLLLKRTPKDYDIFIFEEEPFNKIVKRKGIFDQVPTKKTLEPLKKYPTSYQLYETTLDGEAVQIIFTNQIRRSGWWIRHKVNFTGDDIVSRFDFTCNMVYVNSKKKIVITDEARSAFKEKKIILNSGHQSAFWNKLAATEHLVKRMIYLADKLDFELARDTFNKIYKKYNPSEAFLEELDWIKEPIEEDVDALPF